jgi:hypothetical protein
MKSHWRFASICFLFSFVIIGQSAPTALDEWTLVHPTQPLAPWRGVAYGNGRYVVVAGDAARPQIMWSSNAVDWVNSDANFPHYYSDVLFAEGAFWVSGGEDNAPAVILSSPDGSAWEIVYADPTREFLRRLAYANGTWLGVEVDEDAAPRLVRSTNGSDWTPLDAAPSFNFLDVKDGLWLGMDYQGALYRSTNGLDWSPPALINGFTNINRDSVSGLVTGGGLFVAFGSRLRIDPQNGGYYDVPLILTSSDGANWSTAQIEELPARRLWHVLSIAHGDDGFVAFVRDLLSDDLRLLHSEDGQSWTAHPFPVLTAVQRIMFVNGLYFILGEQGVMLTSADGVTWTQRLGASTRILRGLAEGRKGLVAVGNGGLLLKSSDGVDWTRTEGVTQENLAAIVAHGGRYVIVGGTTHALVLTSANARNWHPVVSLDHGPLQAATLANGDLVLAVGLRGAIARIRTGRVSFHQSPGQEDFRSVTRLGKLYLAVASPSAWPGGAGTIYSSRDGLNWVPRHTHEQALSGIVAGGSRAVAVGAYGSFVSSDGIHWEPMTIAAGYNNWTSVAYANGVFLAGGAGGKVYSSFNGVDWSERQYSPWPDSGLRPNIWSLGGTPTVAAARNRFYVMAAPEYIWRGGLLDSRSVGPR